MWDGRENIETDTPWESTSNDTVWENADDTEDVEWEPQDVEEDAWTADYKDKAPSIKQKSHNSLHRTPKTSANRETAAYTRISGETDSPNHLNAIRPMMIAIITLIVLAIGIFFICKMLVGKDAFSTVKSDKPNAAFVSDHTQNPWENNNIGSTEITETQTNEMIANGYIDAGDRDYVLLYQTPEESAEAVARAYTGDAVEIYALQEQWYQVKLGEVTGYLQADYVTFSKPESTAASTAISDTTTVSETPAETTTIAPVTTTAAPKTTPAATTVPKATTRTVSLTYLGQGTPNSSDGFTNLRETPSLSDNILCAVNNGSVLDVYSFGDSQWYYVQYDGVDGYMKKGYVQLFAEQSPTQNAAVKQYIGRGTSTSADGFLNVHSNPSLSSSNVVDTLPNGAYGDIFDYGDNTWYYIETARGYGYVKASYIHMLQPGEREELVYNSEFGYVSADIYG